MIKYRKHRRKIERIIGRKLEKNEIIHHKDHNSLNNDLSNLEIMTKKEHNIIHFKGKDALYKFRRKEKKQ